MRFRELALSGFFVFTSDRFDLKFRFFFLEWRFIVGCVGDLGVRVVLGGGFLGFFCDILIR